MGLEVSADGNKLSTWYSASDNPHLCVCWDSEYLCKVLEICIYQHNKSCISDQFDEKMNHFLHSWSMKTKISDISLLMQIKENKIQLSSFTPVKHATNSEIQKYQFIINICRRRWYYVHISPLFSDQWMRLCS